MRNIRYNDNTNTVLLRKIEGKVILMQSLVEQLVGNMDESVFAQEQLLEKLTTIAQLHPSLDELVFVCIGTDQSTGDVFGPMMGTVLKQLGFPHVVGTMEDPCDAYKVEKAIAQLPVEKMIVAIDASLGKAKQVGSITIQQGPIQPGAATGRRLPFVGDYSIVGIVNEMGPKAYWKIQNTSLYIVMTMVAALRKAIVTAWKLEKGL